MSEENVEVVCAFYERFARGDFDAFGAFSDNFEFVTSPELPDAGTYRLSHTVHEDVGGVIRPAHDRGHGDHRCRRQGGGRNLSTGQPARKPNRGGGPLVAGRDPARGRGCRS